MVNNVALYSLLTWLVWWLAWMLTGSYAKAALLRVRSRLVEASWLLKVFAFLAMFKPCFLDPLVDFHFPAWFRLSGLVITCVSLQGAVLVREYLGPNWSQFVSLKRGHVLITSGPYSLVRHPIYSALLLAMLGSFLSVGTLGSLIGFCSLLAAFDIKLRQEEQLLLTVFPVEYAELMARTYRLIPGIY